MRNIQVIGERVVWCGGFNWGIGALNKKIYFGKVEEVHWLGIKEQSFVGKTRNQLVSLSEQIVIV